MSFPQAKMTVCSPLNRHFPLFPSCWVGGEMRPPCYHRTSALSFTVIRATKIAWSLFLCHLEPASGKNWRWTCNGWYSDRDLPYSSASSTSQTVCRGRFQNKTEVWMTIYAKVQTSDAVLRGEIGFPRVFPASLPLCEVVTCLGKAEPKHLGGVRNNI